MIEPVKVTIIAKMLVRILIPTGETLSFNVEPSESVGCLKSTIEAKARVAVNRQRLFSDQLGTSLEVNKCDASFPEELDAVLIAFTMKWKCSHIVILGPTASEWQGAQGL